MIHKKSILLWFTIVSLVLFFIGSFNYIVDPYQQYRKAILYPMLFKKNQIYINPGLAKTYDYHSIIIGSSMTQNFIIDKVENILSFNKTIKLSVSDVKAYEEYMILKTAFKHKKIKEVLYGLDISSFRGRWNNSKYGQNFPTYLFDDNLFNDYKYIFNVDVATASVRALINPYRDKNNLLYNYNYMWQWQHEFKDAFGKEKVLKKYLASQGSSKKFDQEAWGIDNLELSFNKNLLSLIKAHPETEFILFYPPYSILTFYDWYKHGVLGSNINFKHYVFEQIKALDNVKLYDFQVAEKVIMNLDNYKDYSHYHQDINTWMLEEIKSDNYRVKSHNIDSYGDKLLKLSKDYIVPKGLKNVE